jgi:enoyl-CoA hydratase/carnithine racemase
VAEFGKFEDLAVDLGDDFVALVEIRRAPNNFFDQTLIGALADAMTALDAEPGCRAVVLASEGKHFCAGANFGKSRDPGLGDVGNSLYDEAVRLFATRTPVVAAVQGAAIGGGLGLALWPDFRVAAPEARFAANFARLGFHHGFGLTVTLSRVVGPQRALELLYTGERIDGARAQEIGLCDRLVPLARLRDEARAFAAEIAASGPLAIDAIRETMRGDLAEQIRAATKHERAEQDRLQHTADFREGVAAMAERRPPVFRGRGRLRRPAAPLTS